MKAIILSGGAGSRLYPLTRIVSKQLQAVFDKPMIYYPLTALIAAGIRDFCLISDPESLPSYQKLLGSGNQLGIKINYLAQARPDGVAQAFLIAADFVGTDSVILMLGDNIFSGGDDLPRTIASFREGATIFAYHVSEPERYGVVQFTRGGNVLSLEEKPAKAKSSFAVPGVYIYDHQVLSIARSIRPSIRGELEITDVNLEYLRRNQLRVHRLSRGFAWLDAGTSGALQEASAYIAAIERRQGVKIGCPEEAALVRGFITLEQFKKLVQAMPNCEYRDYLNLVADEFAEHN